MKKIIAGILIAVFLLSTPLSTFAAMTNSTNYDPNDEFNLTTGQDTSNKGSTLDGSNDFNIRKNVIDISPRIIAANDEFKLIPREKKEVKLEFIKQNWNLNDFKYWQQYEIDFYQF